MAMNALSDSFVSKYSTMARLAVNAAKSVAPAYSSPMRYTRQGSNRATLFAANPVISWAHV